MFYKRIAILIVLFCLSMVAKGQDDADEDGDDNSVVDSLLREYAAATSDTARLNLCKAIGMESNNPDTVLKYASIGISLFDGKDTNSLAYLYGCEGWAYQTKGKYDKAKFFFSKAVDMFRAGGNTDKAVMYAVNLSRAYRNDNAYPEMWRTIYDALREAQQDADTVNICYCYYTIAEFYDEFNMIPQGIEAATKLYHLAEQSHNYEDMILGAAVMSGLLCSDTDADLCRKSIKWAYRAIECYDKAGEVAEFYASLKGDVYAHLSDAYLYLAKIESNDAYIDSASHYIDACEAFAEEYYEDAYTILSQENRAAIKYARHDYKGAKNILHEILEYARTNDVDGYNRQIYRDLARTYDKLGDYRNALKYYELYREQQALFSGSHVIMAAAAFEVKAQIDKENEKVEYEKRIASKDLADKQSHFRRMMIASGVGLVALMLFVFFMWMLLRSTYSGNAMLLSHNEEIKTQNEVLESEKTALATINGKIRESMRYARRIQLATVSSESEIEEVFPGALVYYRPCQIVSGDWYWTTRIGSKRLLALGGCAKNGVPGALVSMMAVNALKDTIGQLSAMSVVSPSAILRTAKSKLPESARNNAAGVSLCVFGRGSVRFAGVNQNVILLKNGNTTLMQGNRPGDMFYTVSEGDVVMMYSSSTKRELLARTSLPEKFCLSLVQKTPAEQKAAIDSMVSQDTQKEDITVVSIII